MIQGNQFANLPESMKTLVHPAERRYIKPDDIIVEASSIRLKSQSNDDIVYEFECPLCPDHGTHCFRSMIRSCSFAYKAQCKCSELGEKQRYCVLAGGTTPVVREEVVKKQK